MTPSSDVNLCFTVRHFAGDVKYDVKGFVEKNQDFVSKEFTEIFLSCKIKLLKKLFGVSAAGVSFDSAITTEDGNSLHRIIDPANINSRRTSQRSGAARIGSVRQSRKG